MKELLSGLIGPVTGIINKVVPDKDEAARLAHEISTMADRHAQALAVAQIEVNRAGGRWKLVSSLVAATMRCISLGSLKSSAALLPTAA